MGIPGMISRMQQFGGNLDFVLAVTALPFMQQCSSVDGSGHHAEHASRWRPSA